MRSSIVSAENEPGILVQDCQILPDYFPALIGAIYDCALDPSRWEQTLAEITAALSSESAILSLNDLRHNRLLIDKSVGWDRFGLEERQKHIPEIHARLEEWFAKRCSVNEPYVASRQLSPDYLRRSPYVQRCLKPLGIVDVMHQFLMRTPSHFSELVIGRHKQHGAITDREIEIGALLLPHLRRAITISNVLDARTVESARMAEVLDTLRCGVVLTDDKATILHANRAAEHMFGTGAAVQGTRGVLSAKSSAAAHELRKAIRVAANNEVMLGKAGLAVRLTEPEARPIFAHVLPMNGSQQRARLQPQAAAAIFIGAPIRAAFDVPPGETKENMRRQFGLTKAEADVAAEVLKGGGRDAVAAQLGVSVTTVRTHLTHIFEKTGVRRQAELVSILLSGEGHG
ncbi:helix-turn-helix transcriptional regulator [Mesorhizobium sp. M0435]|uniref:helix-turn-helix transcriptional regulator n=1 Tax=unclassified Mesorhizobium TaxID=325217 RepID=UPI003336333B